jgi:hypothetical protein
MQFHDQARDVLLNPRVIVEVLSPSTEAFDRGEKFRRYRTWLPTLTDYILVAQDQPLVEHYHRHEEGTWTLHTLEGLQAQLHVSSIGCTVALAAVYDRMVFPPRRHRRQVWCIGCRVGVARAMLSPARASCVCHGRPTASGQAVPARAEHPWSACIWRGMKGTQFAQFSAEVLQHGATAVLPQHLPDRWLDALLEEADLFAPGQWDPEEGDSVDDCCAGLLGAVLVVLMEQRGHPDTLEVAASTLMSHLRCYILALSAERVSRDTDIRVEPPTLVNIFDEEREVRARRRSAEGS